MAASYPTSRPEEPRTAIAALKAARTERFRVSVDVPSDESRWLRSVTIYAMKSAHAILGSAFLLACLPPVTAAEKKVMTVKIMDRQNHDTVYTYFVPGYSTTNANGSASCFGTDSTVNCSGSARATTTTMPAHGGSFSVKGATFALELPDGRIAVVNCDSKFAEHMAGPAGNHRSCREPLVDEIQVEFSGDNAKLIWPVSIDGKKMQSETYKILGVVDKK